MFLAQVKVKFRKTNGSFLKSSLMKLTENNNYFLKNKQNQKRI